MNGFMVLAGVGAVSWILRAGLIVVVPSAKLPVSMRLMLDSAAPAALAALITTQAAQRDLSDPATSFPYVIAAIIAGVVMWRSRNMVATIAAGIAMFWLVGIVVI